MYAFTKIFFWKMYCWINELFYFSADNLVLGMNWRQKLRSTLNLLQRMCIHCHRIRILVLHQLCAAFSPLKNQSQLFVFAWRERIQWMIAISKSTFQDNCNYAQSSWEQSYVHQVNAVWFFHSHLPKRKKILCSTVAKLRNDADVSGRWRAGFLQDK